MAFLSVSEAARRLGKNERTVRRWIDSGALEGSHSVNGRLIIDEAEVARLIGELEKLAGNDQAQRLDELAALSARMTAIEQRLRDLEQGFASLQELLAARPIKQIAPRQSAPLSPRPAPVQAALLTGSDVAQADGLEIATVFAARHFPGESGAQIGRMCQTLRENGSVPMIAGKFKIGKATAGYALDAPGRRAFYLATNERAGFEECDECPHE